MRKSPTRHMRVKKEDLKKWKQYCDTLGENSPTLFNKIINSRKLELDKRIIQERMKKQAEARRKLGLI